MERFVRADLDGVEICTIQMDELMPLILERLVAGQDVRFSPRGVSMLPMLRQGRDTVTLSPVTGRLRKYDLPLYRREDGKYVLHRVVGVADTYTCIGDNQYVKEYGVEHRQVLAVVTSFSRDGKEYGVSSPSYRLYCRFWNVSRFLRRCLRALKFRLLRCFKKR